MRSVLSPLGCILVVGLGVAACRDTSTTDSGPADASDVVTQDVTGHDATDTHPPTDGGGDVAMDTMMGGSLTVQQVANPDDPAHPASRSTVTIAGNLVALSTRFVSGPSAAGNCTYSIWVGDSAGGPFGGIEVVESEAAPTVDGGTACSLDDTGTVVPNNVAIGDHITMITGEYETFCPSGSTCPPNAGAQIFISHLTGTFAVTNVGTGGPTPTPNAAMVTDINGTTMNAAMDLALQNTLVVVHNAFQQVVPVSGTGGNFSTMQISGAMSDTTNELPVVVSSFPSASCLRTALATAGVGANIGDVTGVLYYDFGKWTLHITRTTDISGVMCAPADAGTDAGTDAAVDAPTGG